jgi:hypothetical protein
MSRTFGKKPENIIKKLLYISKPKGRIIPGTSDETMKRTLLIFLTGAG